MSDDEICRFIFAPAFSTATVVTSISGRGVGMDVVRDNIESIGGSVSITTTPGKGTRFSLKIPLTLAIAPALIVAACGHHFALPQHSVIEAVGIDAESAHSLEIGARQPGPALARRGDSRRRSERSPGARIRQPRPTEVGSLVIVMRVSSRAFGVIVDRVADVQEIVVKPLGASLTHLKVFSGHTILGDGSVVLILDPTGIASHLGFERSNDYAAGHTAEVFEPAETNTRFVLFRAGPGRSQRAAAVADRAHRIRCRFGDQEVGRHLCDAASGSADAARPLVSASTRRRCRRSTRFSFSASAAKTWGSWSKKFLMWSNRRSTFRFPAPPHSVIGTAEIRNEVVEILGRDLFHADGASALRSRAPSPITSASCWSTTSRSSATCSHRFLIAAGYRVTTAASGEEALAMFEKGAVFDAVVTDTDMPNMSGYALARKLTDDPRHASLPIIALAAHAAPTVLLAAAESGMRGAVGKFDRNGLLETLGKLLEAHDLNKHDLEFTRHRSRSSMIDIFPPDADGRRRRTAAFASKAKSIASSFSSAARASACQSISVQTIFQIEAVTSVPLGPREVLGLVNLRGKIVTAVSLRQRLQMPEVRNKEAATWRSASNIEAKISPLSSMKSATSSCSIPKGASRCRRTSIIARAKLTEAVYRLDNQILSLLDMGAVFDFQRRN